MNASLRLGPVSIGLSFSRADDRARFFSWYRPFLVSGKKPDWTISVERGRVFSDRLRTPRVAQTPGGFAASWSRFDGSLDERKRTGVLRVSSVAVLGTFLRAFVSRILLSKSGFLIHSAGCRARRSAFAFLGPSGSGKSTMASLWRPESIFSDEVTLVYAKPAARRWYLHGTPFVGDHAVCSAGEAPLEGLFFLRKAPAWRARAVPRAEALARLLRCVLFFGSDKNSMDRILEIAGRLVSAVRAEELSFSKRWPRGGFFGLQPS